MDTLRAGGGEQCLAGMLPLQCPEAFVALPAVASQSHSGVQSPSLGPPTSFGHGEPLTQGSEGCLLAPQGL